MKNNEITNDEPQISQGNSAFEAISSNPNAKLLESVFHDGRPIFALWESENMRVIEPNLQEICLSFHITGSIRVRNNVIGNNNVKFNSIAIYGLNKYEWNIYNKLRYAQLYFWQDLINFNSNKISKILKENKIHGIKDNWIEGLFKMILSYQYNVERKDFILKLYQDCFQHIQKNYFGTQQIISENHGGCTSYQVGKLQEYIEHTYAEKISIDDFCSTMNWSRSHLFREFKKTFGTTPYNFLLHKRLDIAKQLLEEGEQLENICKFSGIENMQKLNYLFMKYIGLSPKQYAQLAYNSLQQTTPAK